MGKDDKPVQYNSEERVLAASGDNTCGYYVWILFQSNSYNNIHT